MLIYYPQGHLLISRTETIFVSGDSSRYNMYFAHMFGHKVALAAGWDRYFDLGEEVPTSLGTHEFR